MIFVSQFYELQKKATRCKDRPFSVSQLTHLFRSVFLDPDVKFNTSRTEQLDETEITVSGTYDPFEDEDGFPSINVTVLASIRQNEFYLREINTDRLFVELCDTIQHEKVHQCQYRRRNYALPEMYKSIHTDQRKKVEEEYLGNVDEIEAYGCSIAVEVILQHGPLASNKVLYERIVDTSTYKLYLTMFPKNHYIVENLVSFGIKYIDTFKEQDYGASRRTA